MESVECVIVGAGVIGLAIARELALAGREVVIVERAPHFGTETSSRNSEVIHAGIYYPPGSKKARFCVAGRHLLYAYCESRGVPYRQCSKLVVATSEAERGALEGIYAAARANGVENLEWVDPATLRSEQPALRCVAALRSPATGIIDSHQYMLSLLGEAEAAGAMIAYATDLTGAEVQPQGIALRFGGSDQPTLSARVLVNAAGLHAAGLARCISGLDRRHVPQTWMAKGCYFTLAGKAPFSTLVYPVPAAGGLGVHLTLDLGGQARFGPDVEWVDTIDYAVPPERGEAFYAAIRAYWPGLADDALQPAYAGIRPKLSGPGEPAADFRIDGPGVHGVPGLVNLFGIESPGLTASLAIARYVAELLA